MTDKTTPAATNPAASDKPAATKEYTVKTEFWLGDTCCKAGDKVQLTNSQAKRVADLLEA